MIKSEPQEGQIDRRSLPPLGGAIARSVLSLLILRRSFPALGFPRQRQNRLRIRWVLIRSALSSFVSHQTVYGTLKFHNKVPQSFGPRHVAPQKVFFASP